MSVRPALHLLAFVLAGVSLVIVAVFGAIVVLAYRAYPSEPIERPHPLSRGIPGSSTGVRFASIKEARTPWLTYTMPQMYSVAQ
jgi:hypothetical protein